ncbi:LysR family transcriptional regulator, partial [Pectobacterium brasiliense]|nr:LysR family transcriptional regulator [Pectobacterium brasiliense]
FSIDVHFTVSLISPLHSPASALVDTVIDKLKQYAAEVPSRLEQVLQR